MRILLITDNHTPTGGAEKYFFDLKSRLQALPHLKVMSLGYASKTEQGIDFQTFKAPTRKIVQLFWRIFTNPRQKRLLEMKIHAFKPDIIHLHNIKQFTPSILKAVKSYPVIQTVHDHGIVCPTAQNIHKDMTPCKTGIQTSCLLKHHVKFNLLTYLISLIAFYQNRLHIKKTVNTFHCPSPLLADYLKLNHFNQVKHIYLFKEKTSPIIPLNTTPSRFLFAGQLAKHKGAHILIQEFITAANQHLTIELDIIGTGEEESHMKRLVANANLTHRIHFHGWQTNPSPFFERAFAVLFPSIGLEGFPLVLMEALNRGRPVIGVNRGITAWLISNQETGLLFDPLTPGDLAQKILDLAEHPEKARAMGLCGQAKLNHLIDNEKTLETLLKTYRDTIIHCHTRRPLAPV